jgi:hypothetical protein
MALESCNVDMYADDSTLHTSSSNINEIQSRLQNDIGNIDKWCKNNNMALNPSKSTCMLLGTKNKLKSSDSLVITLNQIQLENVHYQNILGIIVDESIKWQVQLDKICSKLNSKLYLFNRISKYLTSETKKIYYNAYILPIIDYGVISWGQCSKINKDRIINFQRRFAKLVLGKSDSSTNAQLFSELEWLSFNDRIKYHTASLVYKTLHNLAPQYLHDLIEITQNTSYNLRSNSMQYLVHPKLNTEFMKKTFSYSGMIIWNEVPISIKILNNLNLFKKAYKQHLLTTIA